MGGGSASAHVFTSTGLNHHMAKLRADRRINLIESFDNVLTNQRKRILYNFHLSDEPTWKPIGTFGDYPDALDRAKYRHRTMTLGPALHRSEDIEVEIKRAWTGQIIR
jgi:hypothetical protein